MIQQSAFIVTTQGHTFIGNVAFNPDSMSALTAATRAWGTDSEYKELSWQELASMTRAGGYAVYAYTCNDK